MGLGQQTSVGIMSVSEEEEVAALRADLETMRGKKKPRKLNWLECGWKRKLVTRKIGNMG